jgi:hypothetical protein
MNRMTRRIVFAVTLTGVAFAQMFRYTQTEATTARFDAQRSGWIRLDHFIAPDKMSGFSLQRKTKLDNTPGNGAALSGGIVTNGGLSHCSDTGLCALDCCQSTTGPYLLRVKKWGSPVVGTEACG